MRGIGTLVRHSGEGRNPGRTPDAGPRLEFPPVKSGAGGTLHMAGLVACLVGLRQTLVGHCEGTLG